MKSFKILSLLALSTLLVGCTAHKGNEAPTPEPEPLDPLDQAISEFLSDTNLTVPSLKSFNMEFEVAYYYSYGSYFIYAECADAAGTLEDEYSALITTDTNWVVYNDDDYTVAEYGHMYADDFDNANVELDVDSANGYFSIYLFRWDGEHGQLDVSNVDTSWYVDYVNFYGYEVSNTFPSEDIEQIMGLNVIGPNADEFCYGFADEYTDDEGYHAAEFIVLLASDVSAMYASALEGQGYTITSVDDWTITEDWDIVDYTVYSGYDASHSVYISFYYLNGIMMIEIFNFDDIFVDQLTSNTDWTSAEKATMNQYLGQVLPFVQLGAGYVVGQGQDYYGDSLVYIMDAYYLDLTSSIAQALMNDGFHPSVDSYQDTFYEYDNHVIYIAVYLSYSNGNMISAYYEATHYIEATAIELSDEEVEIVAGNNYQLTATMTPANANSTYSYSSNQQWCTVNETGTVSISSEAPVDGEAIVTVTTSENRTDTCKFIVAADVVTGLILNCGNSLELAPGESYVVEVIGYLPYGVTPTCSLSYGQESPINEDVEVYGTGNINIVQDATIGGTATVYVLYGSTPEPVRIDILVTVVAPSVTETLTQATFGLTDGSTTYNTYTSTGTIGTYTAQCAAAHGIQIRSKTSNSGIIGSYTGKVAKSITITFDSNTDTGRTVDIYASNTAFAITDMYGDTVTKVGSVSYDGNNSEVTYQFTESYSYIGIRSRNGAIYMTSVAVTWR